MWMRINHWLSNEDIKLQKKKKNYVTLKISNADKNAYQQELSYIDWRDSHLEDNLAVSYKTKSSKWKLFKWIENLCSYKNLHMDIQSSFIPNC